MEEQFLGWRDSLRRYNVVRVQNGRTALRHLFARMRFLEQLFGDLTEVVYEPYYGVLL